MDYLPGAWKVFELSFYTGPDCVSGELAGIPVASSEDLNTGEASYQAFDRDIFSAWGASCKTGCLPGTAWIGLVLPQAFERVRCVKLKQSEVPCCGSRNVRLEVWDGAVWQVMQAWDTQSFSRSAVSGYELVVPITCHKGLPEGVGVVHDCIGLPVVGQQEGDTCPVKCLDGFYGDATSFTCGGDGILTGPTPVCYDMQAIGRWASFASIGGALLFLAWQYRFWCMFRKITLAYDVDVIPKALHGRWLEKDGMHVWDVMLAEQRKEENLSAFDFKKEEEDPDSDPRDPKAFLNKKKKKKEAKEKIGMDLEDGDPTGKVYLDGCCSPCEDPDVCLSFVFCPLCRIADTWHTIGTPSYLGYWTVFLMYVLFPFCWPCLNFCGRLRVRKTFDIPLEPHRDCLIHCCCCCCCAPCALCQEARIVDAPGIFFHVKRRLQEKKDQGIL